MDKSLKLIIFSVIVLIVLFVVGFLSIGLTLFVSDTFIGNLESKEGCFIDNEDGTVTDNCSNLMWKKNNEFEPVDWEMAKQICESDITAGYNDWRLPTKEELELFVDKDCQLNNLPNENCVGIWINSIFDASGWNSKIRYYWSSTIVTSPVDKLTYILMASEFGLIGTYSELRSKNNSIGVRCVRST